MRVLSTHERLKDPLSNISSACREVVSSNTTPPPPRRIVSIPRRDRDASASQLPAVSPAPRPGTLSEVPKPFTDPYIGLEDDEFDDGFDSSDGELERQEKACRQKVRA